MAFDFKTRTRPDETRTRPDAVLCTLCTTRTHVSGKLQSEG